MICDTSNMFDANEFKKTALGLLLGLGIGAVIGGLVYNAWPEKAATVLLEEGYTNIKITDFTGCAKNIKLDTVHLKQ